jgi:cell division protein FtsX
MFVDATATEVDDVRATILARRDVVRFAHFDKEDALREFARIFSDDPDLVETVTADELPESFRIVTTKQARFQGMKRDFERLVGVEKVIVPHPDSIGELRDQCRAYRLRPRWIDAEVFVTVQAPPSAIRRVRQVLEHSDSVERLQYLDKQDALREARRRFADDPELVKTLEADFLPTSFRIALGERADVKQLVRSVGRLAEVDRVARDGARLREICDDLAP